MSALGVHGDFSRRNKSLGVPRLLPPLLFVGTFLIGLNTTMFNVVLPEIVMKTGATPIQSNLAVISYLAVMTALLLPCGQISDRVSSRVFLSIGFGLIALGGTAIAITGEANVLIGLRMLQGAGAAVILSAGGAAIVRVIPKHRIPAAMGVYLAGFSLGQVAGPVLPGFLHNLLSFELFFIPFAPAGVMILAAGWIVLPSSPLNWPVLIDRWGTLFAVLGSFCLFGLTTVPSGFVSSPLIMVALIALAIVSGIGVWRSGLRSRQPLVDPVLLRNHAFMRPLLGTAVMMLPRLSLPIVLVLYLLAVVGYSPARVALAVAPLAIGVTLSSLMAGVTLRWWRTESTTRAGALLATFGLSGVWISLETDSLGGLASAMAIIGLGSGLYGALASGLVLSRAPQDRAGSANGLRAAATTMSFSVGVAIALAILMRGLSANERENFYAASGLPASAITQAQGSMTIFLIVCLACSCAAAALVSSVRQSNSIGHPEKEIVA